MEMEPRSATRPAATMSEVTVVPGARCREKAPTIGCVEAVPIKLNAVAAVAASYQTRPKRRLSLCMEKSRSPRG